MNNKLKKKNFSGQIVILRYHRVPWRTWHRASADRDFEILDDALLSKKIPTYSSLHEKARAKRLEDFLNACEVVRDFKIPLLRNCNCLDCDCDLDVFRQGAHLLLATTELFENRSVGYHLVACTLAGMRCTALREVAPDFRPRLLIRSQDETVARILTAWVQACIPRERWKRKKRRPRILRKSVLDFRKHNPYQFESDKRLLDFDRVKIKIKRQSIRIPIPYENTLAAVIDASGSQLNELAPLTENAAVIFINCKRLEGGATTFTGGDVSSHDPTLLDTLEEPESSNAMAWLLRDWGKIDCSDSSDWAETILRRAKLSLGKPDRRYVSVTFDADVLRTAIFHEVFLDFLALCEGCEFISSFEAAAYRTGAKAVFSPEPDTPPELRCMEDPVIFLDLLRQWRQQHPDMIAAKDQPLGKSSKLIGAVRSIGKPDPVDYLVLQEVWLTKHYLPLARKAKCCTDFASAPDWTQKIQRKLCEAEVLKRSGSGFRYRYDLFENGSRDNTYVLAIPLSRLDV